MQRKAFITSQWKPVLLRSPENIAKSSRNQCFNFLEGSDLAYPGQINRYNGLGQPFKLKEICRLCHMTRLHLYQAKQIWNTTRFFTQCLNWTILSADLSPNCKTSGKDRAEGTQRRTYE
ncbi:uncharacterized protein PHALS_06551 [Plasmopara halstedii]|uniref:Uncharacterized protein n=1 Tax=Plasmopara halstedii TaxID=4781 RepID=A0A0P1B365_PLAHL|nr:uncharacterized protein PHALS_06551 [Plasmopara halstedii]CEG48745.1 hypothetical protein PHALS_06551 [Plasmopara halstedii]|eukprot:XP_024585114.1 hypothetical protein PHALS_06551 [Plasmopara halstedii]